MAKITAEGKAIFPRVVASGEVTIKGYPPTVVITEAMASAGVDTVPMAAAIIKLTSHEQKALEDKSMTPGELRVPRPDGYTDERAADLASSFASDIRENRQHKLTRIIAVVSIVTGIIIAVIGAVL